MKAKFLEPDYEGVSKVINSFVELYKICENKKLVDALLESFTKPFLIIETNETDKEKCALNTNDGRQTIID